MNSKKKDCTVNTQEMDTSSEYVNVFIIFLLKLFNFIQNLLKACISLNSWFFPLVQQNLVHIVVCSVRQVCIVDCHDHGATSRVDDYQSCGVAHSIFFFFMWEHRGDRTLQLILSIAVVEGERGKAMSVKLEVLP